MTKYAGSESRGTDMSMKPDYEAATAVLNYHLDRLQVFSNFDTDHQVRFGVDAVQKIVDAALGGDPTAFAVAALIAEGGEIRHTLKDPYQNRLPVPKPGRWLAYGPIPAEETTP